MYLPLPNMHVSTSQCYQKSLYSGTCVLWTPWHHPDYQGVLIFQVSLHNNVLFGTTARYVNYAGVRIFKCPD